MEAIKIMELKQQINNDPNTNSRIEAEQGILIVRVVPNSPADKAGLRAGDVIQEMGDRPVTDAQEIVQILEKNDIGSNIAIEVLRNGRTLQLTVRPEALPPLTENQ